jgi:hypothetical protein
VSGEGTHDKTVDKIFMAALERHSDDKLTGFALRLLAEHIAIPREGEPNLLT